MLKILELPSYHHAFIGRSSQIRSVCLLLQQKTTRLVTLHGPGGVGKTRLSIKIGEEMAPVFEDGVCFVPLDTVVDYQQVPRHIGNRLNLKESFYDTWIDAIIDFLADKHLLLILDNLEQILESTTVITQVIENCPRVKILATSREILGLLEEIEYSIGSLNRPNPKLFPEPKDLLRFDAIRLFIQQAQFSLPDFQLNKENAEAVVKICDLLEGQPLPIELAAARLKLFSPEVIFTKLSANNNLLKTQNKHVALRHKTIWNMVKWSYDLLDLHEQIIFQKLSLFQGGFTFDALEAVCPEEDALEIVESFINKSLIVRGKEVDLIPRFQMLKLIRDYGLEQLEKNSDKSIYYGLFAKYFMILAEEGALKLRSTEQVKWIALIDADYQNISAALEWLIANQPEWAAQMGHNFWRFHLNRGFLKEGLSMIETLLSLQIKDNVIRSKLLEGAGTLSHNLGNYLKAKAYFERSLKLSMLLQDKTQIANTLNNVSWAEWRVGNYELTISYAERARDLFLQLKDKLGQAKSHNNLAWTFQYKGLFEEAATLQRQILDIYTKSNNRQGIAFAKVCLAKALLKLGEVDEAEQLIEKGIALFQGLRNQQLVAFSYLIKAEHDYEAGNYKAAKEMLSKYSLSEFEKIGDVWGIATSHHHLGEIYFQENRTEQAKFHWDRALELFRNSSDKFGEASTCLGLSQFYFSKNNEIRAENFLEKGLELATQMKGNELLANAYLQKALQTQQNSLADAIKFLNTAKYYAKKLGNYQYQKFQLSISLHPNLLQFEPELTPHSNVENKNEPDILQHAANTEENPFIRKARAIVEANLANSAFSVKDFCMEVGMSHSQLHRKLSSKTGQSITQFIRSIRLDKARQLLLNQNLTIAAIAYETGFKDPDYFYRVFKKTFQMTPTAYRKLAEEYCKDR